MTDEEDDDDDDEEEDYGKLTVAVLKQRLTALGLPIDGKKAMLVGRMEKQPLGASRKGN